MFCAWYGMVCTRDHMHVMCMILNMFLSGIPRDQIYMYNYIRFMILLSVWYYLCCIISICVFSDTLRVMCMLCMYVVFMTLHMFVQDIAYSLCIACLICMILSVFGSTYININNVWFWEINIFCLSYFEHTEKRRNYNHH